MDENDAATPEPTDVVDVPLTPATALKVRVDAIGHGTVDVNGEDLTTVTAGVDISSRGGEVTQAVIHLLPGAEIDFDGEAQVTVVQSYAEADPAAISEWISRVDPKALEEAALNRLDLRNDQAHGLTQALLTQLTEWARGEI